MSGHSTLYVLCPAHLVNLMQRRSWYAASRRPAVGDQK
jgi:hypothetical protein